MRLSICVATYNRAAFIGDTIDSILAQLPEGVELLVVDGASTDSTERVVAERILGHQRARYVRLPNKGGVDQDYCRAVQLASGEYVWLFTDDDLLLPGAVAQVLAALEPDVDLLVLNAEVRDATMERLVVPRRDPAKQDRTYASFEMDRLFRDQAATLTYIGAVVIRRAVWASRPPERFFGSEFVHVGVIFSAPLPGRTLAIARPLISIRLGNAHWAPRAFDIWNLKWPRLVASLEGVSEHVRQEVAPRDPWRRLRTLIHARALGIFGGAQLRSLVDHHPVGRVWQFAAGLVAFSPRGLVHPAVDWYFRHLRTSTELERDALATARPKRFFACRSCSQGRTPG